MQKVKQQMLSNKKKKKTFFKQFILYKYTWVYNIWKDYTKYVLYMAYTYKHACNSQFNGVQARRYTMNADKSNRHKRQYCRILEDF